MSGPRTAVIGTVLLVLTGCQTTRTTSDGRPPAPEPNRAPRTPTFAAPNRLMVLVAGKAEDTDGNGYADLIRVRAALFAQPHPSATIAPGAFVFTLYRLGEAMEPEAEPVAAWRFDDEEARARLGTAMYGPCYQFELRLKDVGSDRHPAMRADLRGRFEPADGTDAVHASDEVRTVQIGWLRTP